MMEKLYKHEPRGYFTVFHSCMHGGARDKATKFWSFNPRVPSENLFESLGLLCDGNHTHQSWRPRFVTGKWVFPTKDEAAYPHLLCVRMASVLLQEAVARGLGPDDDLSQQLEHDPTVGKRQIFTTQPRQQKLRPAISEFGYFMQLALTVSDAPSNFLETMCPKGSKVVSRHVQRGFQRDVFLATKNAAVVNHIGEGEVFEVVKVGVPREPQQFITAAVELGHPRFLLARVSKDALGAVNGLLGDAANLSLQRSKFLKRLLQRANELRQQEAELHDNLPVHLKKVLEGKRILRLNSLKKMMALL